MLESIVFISSSASSPSEGFRVGKVLLRFRSGICGNLRPDPLRTNPSFVNPRVRPGAGDLGDKELLSVDVFAVVVVEVVVAVVLAVLFIIPFLIILLILLWPGSRELWFDDRTGRDEGPVAWWGRVIPIVWVSTLVFGLSTCLFLYLENI